MKRWLQEILQRIKGQQPVYEVRFDPTGIKLKKVK
jgi:hypothetical protein